MVIKRKRKDILPAFMVNIPLPFLLHTLRKSKSTHRIKASHDAACVHNVRGGLLDQLLDVSLQKTVKCLLGCRKECKRETYVVRIMRGNA